MAPPARPAECTPLTPSMVHEIKPSPGLWQSDWSLHQDNRQPKGRGGCIREESIEDEASLQDVAPEGCNSFRLWISSEALGEVWTALLGQRASQEYLMESWSSCLRFN